MKLYQPLTGAAEILFDYTQTIPVIDTHEHVPRSEADYNASTIHFGNLFNPYVSNDLASAGMPGFDKGQWAAFVCIGDDWDTFEPYWNAVKHGSYARPVRIALQHFYGVNDFTRENYRELVKKINENNTPGIYTRIFKEACNIEKAIRCADNLPDKDDPVLLGNVGTPARQLTSPAHLKMLEEQSGTSINTLEDLGAVINHLMEKDAAEGAIEFKSAAMPFDYVDLEAGEALLQRVRNGETLDNRSAAPLQVCMREAAAVKCAELGLPMALHTGVWQDYRTVDVNDIVSFVQRNPATQFDVYHLGIPEVRPAIQLVKNFPNAWLNLCWAHVVASDMVVNTLKEAIDMVPMNKIFAFGADYVLFIEKVYGHLHMAKENCAIALGDRVDRDLMDLDEAKEIIKAWFYDNPKSFYRI